MRARRSALHGPHRDDARLPIDVPRVGGRAHEFPRELAEAALAHVVGDAVERAYARSDLFDRRRKLMDALACYLTAPATAATGDNVRDLGARRAGMKEGNGNGEN